MTMKNHAGVPLEHRTYPGSGMEDRAFDELVKRLASGRSRRALLKGALGLGGAAVAGARLETEAARRGYSGPPFPPGNDPDPGPTCDPSTCYGCNSCVNNVCVGDPTDCYVHDCMASVCDPDGGCSYPFDCRHGSDCCPAHHICDTSTGQCECNPLDKCCNVECSNCLTCVDGACVPDNSLCPDFGPCVAMICQPDGSCNEVLDCRTGTPTECCGQNGTCGADGQCSNADI
ncbi:MAG TPA: hypothetical protein VFP05_10975 [Thermomicrobiales bacterium]|nr:hypothetical protein [Thermomicrobiales bacterium]